MGTLRRMPSFQEASAMMMGKGKDGRRLKCAFVWNLMFRSDAMCVISLSHVMDMLTPDVKIALE